MRHETITHYELSIQLKDAPQADYAVHQIQDFAYVGDSLKVQTAQGTDYYLLSNITNVFYDAQTSTAQLSSDYGVQVANNPLQGNRLDLQCRLRTEPRHNYSCSTSRVNCSYSSLLMRKRSLQA